MKRILVFGAGPLGSIFATQLQEAGHDVSVLARGQRLQDLREHGIVLLDAETGQRKVTRVNPVESLGREDYYDMVMVIMRKNQALEALPVLAENERVPTFVFMMNNAAGPTRFIDALGEDRVMVGFPCPGGVREGHTIRALSVNERTSWPLPIGEADGQMRERTLDVAGALRRMPGYRVEVRRDMDAWLKYHVALLMPAFAPLLYACGTDVKRMARTPDALVLAVRGIKEAVRALQRAGVPTSPRPLVPLPHIPEPLFVAALRKVLCMPAIEVSGEGHAAAARDEMEHLTDEFLAFLRQRGVGTPLLDDLYGYFDPTAAEIAEGSCDLPMDYRGIWIPAAAVVALLVAILLLRRD